MDVTSAVPEGRQYIEGYGAGRFRVSGVVHQGAVLVLRTRTLPWPVASLADVTADSLAPVIEAGDVAVLLLGCGPRMAMVPAALRDRLRAAGVVVEPMDTGGACRTYNVLLAEDRLVAAALLPIE
ncbi:MAG TPA: Mth938-like domain-containing protein [Candidatus Sulfotelmatobacter sp.]|nr:Mth938-like domain-containing protein [Candidatus Sulfotelmatobacter sp.]